MLSVLPVQWREKNVDYVRRLTGTWFYVGTERFKDFSYTALGQKLGFEHVISLGAVTHFGKE